MQQAANADIVAVSTTLDDEAAARTLARRLVEERLAACVQSVPIRSVYRWKGEVREAAEFLLVAKTTACAAPRLCEVVKRCHPYELPEIVVTPVAGGSDAYLRWVADNSA